jgi:hypothetical protein
VPQRAEGEEHDPFVIVRTVANGLAALSAAAQTTLTPVEPKVSCASLRGFDPRIPEAPTQVTDARETGVKASPACASSRSVGLPAMRVMTTNCNPISAPADDPTMT